MVDLADLESINKAGVILFPDELMGSIGRVNIHDVGGVVAIPARGKVNCRTGQINLTGSSTHVAEKPSLQSQVVASACMSQVVRLWIS